MNKTRYKIRYIVVLICIMSILASYQIKVFAGDDGGIPEPIKVVDFSYSFTELSLQDTNFAVTENAAAPSIVYDSQMGRVLKLGKTVAGDDEVDPICGAIISDKSEHSEIKLTNPYKGLTNLKECEIYDCVELKSYNTDYRYSLQPEWKKGITISYWIKAPEYTNSSVLGFYSERFQMQSSDYSKYITTYRFDLEYNLYSDEEKILLGYNESGVDKSSDFYFEYAEGQIHNDKPLYVDENHMGKLYYMNKNYVPGYILNENGEIVESKSSVLYKDYVEAPYLGSNAEEHDSKNSNIRYAWTRSEMWMDASSSMYYISDLYAHSYEDKTSCNTDKYNVQLNRNHVDTFGENIAIDAQNHFYLNSWSAESDFDEAYNEWNVAPSPLSVPDKWHYVTIIIQNDWVSYYLDGEKVDILEDYGIENTPLSDTWKRFNKGTGARYGYGKEGKISESTYNSMYTGYVSPTIMDWIVMDSTEMVVGGAGNKKLVYDIGCETDEILIKNIVFYDEILTDEDIKTLSKNPDYYADRYPYLGDANNDNDVTARDALAILKHVAKISEAENSDLLDVNFDDALNAEDALLVLKYVANIISSF